jgi:hypothetical protein
MCRAVLSRRQQCQGRDPDVVIGVLRRLGRRVERLSQELA